MCVCMYMYIYMYTIYICVYAYEWRPLTDFWGKEKGFQLLQGALRSHATARVIWSCQNGSSHGQREDFLVQRNVTHFWAKWITQVEKGESLVEKEERFLGTVIIRFKGQDFLQKLRRITAASSCMKVVL